MRRGRLALLAAGLVLVSLAGATVSLAPFTDAATTNGSLSAGTLAPPTGLAASAGTTVSLSWTATTSTAASGYHLLRATASGGPYSQIADVTPRTTVIYVDSPAVGTYHYKLRSYLQNWESLDAGPVSATVSAAQVSTGYKACVGASNAADTSGAGDNDGYQTNPARACTLDGLLAVDANSGTGGTQSCGSGAAPDANKDRHRFWGYAFGLPGVVASIDGIQVQATLKLNGNGGTSNICAQLSWDGGATWTTIKSQGVSGGTTLTAYTFGATSDTWGNSWTLTQLNTTNFRVRVIDASTQSTKDFSLDYLSVQVTYTP